MNTDTIIFFFLINLNAVQYMCVSHPAGSAGLVPGVRGTEQENADGDLASAPTAATATAAEYPKGKIIICIIFISVNLLCTAAPPPEESEISSIVYISMVFMCIQDI